MLTKIRDAIASLRPNPTAARVCKAAKGAAFCDRTLLRALQEAMAAVKVEYWYRSRKGTANLAKTLTLSVHQMETDILDKIIDHADATLATRVRHPRSAHFDCWPEDHVRAFKQRMLSEDDSLARSYTNNLMKHAENSGLDRPTKYYLHADL